MQTVCALLALVASVAVGVASHAAILSEGITASQVRQWGADRRGVRHGVTVTATVTVTVTVTLAVRVTMAIGVASYAASC